MRSQNELILSWRKEELEPFEGWDFSYLSGRMIEEKTPWSYEGRAAELMQSASAVLDLDTGGGERLLSLQEHWPKKVVVTEGYPPNIRLAMERLSPLGGQVVATEVDEGNELPFADGEFDLVLNRHGAINSVEIPRILSPAGTFLTQQVHELWAQDLRAAFDLQPTAPDETFEGCVSKLTAADMEIVQAEDWQGTLRFTDVGAIVYYLKAVPWMVPGFTVETHLNYLLKLQERLEVNGELIFEARKYLIEAKKKD